MSAAGAGKVLGGSSLFRERGPASLRLPQDAGGPVDVDTARRRQIDVGDLKLLVRDTEDDVDSTPEIIAAPRWSHKATSSLKIAEAEDRGHRPSQFGSSSSVRTILGHPMLFKIEVSAGHR